MDRRIFNCFSISFVRIGWLLKVVAQQTGTRIKGVESSYQESVVWFDQPHEITDIRLLL